MERISKEIRLKLRDLTNTFDGSFVEEPPLPDELLILLNLLVSGSSDDHENGFSLPIKTLAQIIFYNHKRQTRKKANERGTTTYYKPRITFPPLHRL